MPIVSPGKIRSLPGVTHSPIISLGEIQMRQVIIERHLTLIIPDRGREEQDIVFLPRKKRARTGSNISIVEVEEQPEDSIHQTNILRMITKFVMTNLQRKVNILTSKMTNS